MIENFQTGDKSGAFYNQLIGFDLLHIFSINTNFSNNKSGSQFPLGLTSDVARAKEWWNSERYTEAKKIRQAASTTKMVIVEGI